jgi:hypothetical protein
MDVNNCHSPTALLLRKQLLVSIGQENVKAPELVWTLHNRKFSTSGRY